MRDFFVYIMSSDTRCLYIGVTSDLTKRVFEHKNGVMEGFTKRYRVAKLVYFEQTSEIHSAIAREKQLKAWPRWRKVRLIEATNWDWRDLAIDWFPSAVKG